ncbi:MAG: hypothetical protein LBD37_03050 [Treponema sp.]|nr:hypothetical protein [Treponema sp.]
MKKTLFSLSLIMIASAACFSRELIGSRLKYEIRGGSERRFVAEIGDVYEDGWGYQFSIQHNVADIYDIFATSIYFHRKIGAADLYSQDFPEVISRYIIRTSQEGNHSPEWRQYASAIAARITQYVKGFHRR